MHGAAWEVVRERMRVVAWRPTYVICPRMQSHQVACGCATLCKNWAAGALAVSMHEQRCRVHRHTLKSLEASSIPVSACCSCSNSRFACIFICALRCCATVLELSSTACVCVCSVGVRKQYRHSNVLALARSVHAAAQPPTGAPDLRHRHVLAEDSMSWRRMSFQGLALGPDPLQRPSSRGAAMGRTVRLLVPVVNHPGAPTAIWVLCRRYPCCSMPPPAVQSGGAVDKGS